MFINPFANTGAYSAFDAAPSTTIQRATLTPAQAYAQPTQQRPAVTVAEDVDFQEFHQQGYKGDAGDYPAPARGQSVDILV